VDATDRDAVKRPIQRRRDGLSERRLADAGRAQHAEDAPLGITAQVAHGEEFEHALLDLRLKKRSTGHTHTHADREEHPRHRHTRTRQEKTPQAPKRTPPTNT